MPPREGDLGLILLRHKGREGSEGGGIVWAQQGSGKRRRKGVSDAASEGSDRGRDVTLGSQRRRREAVLVRRRGWRGSTSRRAVRSPNPARAPAMRRL